MRKIFSHSILFLLMITFISLSYGAEFNEAKCKSKMIRAIYLLELVNHGKEYAQGLDFDAPIFKGQIESQSSPGVNLRLYEVHSDFQGGTGIHEVAVTPDEYCSIELIRFVYSE